MYKKTFGMFVVALMLISLTGVVYANWCMAIQVDTTIETGTVCIGIANVGVNDPPGTNDYVWDGQMIVQTHKDVANVTSENITSKCALDGSTYYQKVRFNITEAYPWYVAVENISLANCGTIPVFIEDIKLDSFTGDTDIIECIDLSWAVRDPNTGQTIYGDTWQGLEELLYTIQIDGGETVEVSLQFMFLQCIEPNMRVSFEITVTAAQWNEVAFWPPTNGGA